MASDELKRRMLDDLWSGNKNLRERALLLVDARVRDKVREVAVVRQDTQLLREVMFADLRHAAKQLEKNFDDQFYRRTAIRTLAASVDGMVFVMKRLATHTAPLTGAKFDDEELQFLREERQSPMGKRLRLPGFRENLKQTFKLFCKAHSADCPTDFGDKGFDALCDTIELRHRVTHPKSFMTFRVLDEESKQAAQAMVWLGAEMHKVYEASQSALNALNLDAQ